MANFKINIGDWKEYRPFSSLDLPESDRNNPLWGKSIQTGTALTFGVISTTSAQVKSGYCFQLSTPIVTPSCMHYYYDIAPSYWKKNVSMDRGYTMETQVKAISSGTRGASVIMSDEQYYEQIFFNTNSIGFVGANVTYPYILTDDFHTIRLAIQGGVQKLYIDNALYATIACTYSGGDGVASRYFYWGDATGAAGYGGNVLFAYVKYNINGAYPPNERAENGWAFDKLDIQESNRRSQFPIIRSDNVVMPATKKNASKIRMSGTLAGSCYNSFRDTLRRLKRTLAVDIQKVYIDDERYIEASHDTLMVTPVTQDMSNIKLDMSAQNPYFYNIVPEYFSTAPVSNGTFYVVNNGDVEVPCKIILTGGASGTVDDNISMQNATLEQIMSYRGVVSATQELVIDKGYDTFNTYKIELEGASVFNSYEGDIFTLQSGVNAFVYTGGVMGTIEIYWREGYML